MRKRVAVIGSLVLLILVAAFILILQTNYLPEKIEKNITPLVEEAIGRHIKFSGSYLSIFPFYWQLNNASLIDTKTGDVLLKAKGVTIYMSLSRLLLDEVFIRDIRFREPNLSIIRYSDGETNLKKLFPDQKPTKWEVIINRISISKGLIRINDLLADKSIIFSDVDLRIFPDLKKKEFRGDVTAEGSYRDRNISRQGVKIKGDVTVGIKNKDLGIVRVSGLDVTTPAGSMLKVDGMIGGDGMVDLNGKAAISLMELSDLTGNRKNLKGKLIFAGSAKGTLSMPVVEGSVTTDGLSYDKVSYGNIKGEVSYKEKILDLTGIKGEVLGGSVKGGMEIDFRNSIPSTHLKMKVDNARPHRVITRYISDPEIPLEKNGVVSGEVDLWGEGFDKDTLQGKGWAAYKDSRQSISLSGVINKGLGINAGISGDLADIAGYLHIPHFPLHGTATLTGEVTGLLSKPVISGTIMMTNGVVKDTTFDTVTAGLKFSDGELLLQPVVFRRKDAVYSLYGSIRFQTAGVKETRFDLKGDISHGDPNDFVSIFYKNIPLDMKADGHSMLTGDTKDFQWTFDLKSASGTAYSQGFDSSEVVFTISKERLVFD
ncbi:MAG: AsmA family protein, partial [Nitrospira sp.]|nr:AsmA family protein [Nitrospira sp.]